MLKGEEEQSLGGSWKTYSRSVSWTERPPRKSNAKPQWNSKVRACLPPLSIIRPSIEEWPRAGSDDLGIWPNPPTPGANLGSLTPRENSSSGKPPRDFDFRKDKLAFYDKECSRILDHIYLGSDAVAKNREILHQNGITHVLNCVGFVCPEYFKNELVYKTLWLQDCPSEDITSILYDVFDYFEDVREQGRRVLVHCYQGVSRSTSLVIAYLMWKEGMSFDDAFQHVKAARGVTNPNVGFACQLLQCQKRVHALPASPTSVLRIYRMAPHSPYDPLHLVPKMLCEPGEHKLDSRGAFIIHIPSALYVWIGQHCSPVMADNAMAAASQVVRYERAEGPVITTKEGEETFEFWDALRFRKGLIDDCGVKPENVFVESDMMPSLAHKSVGQRKLSDTVPSMARHSVGQRKLPDYDLDFNIFDRALIGGVVPPCPLLEGGSETCLPARENGWNKLRKKFVSGIMKEFITSSKLNPSSFMEHGMEFEIFDRALTGGTVSPCPFLEAGSETYLPARENGWSRLRRKFSSGLVKEFINSSNLKSSSFPAYNVDFNIVHREVGGGGLSPCPLLEAGSDTHLFTGENGWSRVRKKFSSGILKEFSTLSKLNPSAFPGYSLDFELFDRALVGGIITPCPLLEARAGTWLPSIANGWSRLRRLFANGTVKEYITSFKLKSSALQSGGLNSIDSFEEVEDFVSAADNLVSSSSQCDSPDSFTSYVTSSPGWSKNNLKEVEFPASLADISLSQSPPFHTVEFPSPFLVSKLKSISASPSLSPSTSDYSSSFTFSPSSCNWSDASIVSAQPSPNGLEIRGTDPGKSIPVEEVDGPVDGSASILRNVTSPLPLETFSGSHVSGAASSCSSFVETLPSSAEQRGSNFHFRAITPSTYQPLHNTEIMLSFLDNDAMEDTESKNVIGISSEMEGGVPISKAYN